MSAVQTYLLTGFDDPRLPPEKWQRLLERGDTNVVFLTRQWLSAWWETLGKGEMLLIAAERAGEIVALAPFFTISGMIYFLGTGESDYLDIIGGGCDPEVMLALLATARECVADFVGMKLYFVSDRSRTGPCLQAAAERLNLNCILRDEIDSVEVDLAGQRDAVHESLARSMLKRENYFRDHGQFVIRRETEAAAIRPLLPEFYAQYTARWTAKGLPSELADPAHCAFYERFLETAADTGWIRYLQLDFDGRVLAAELAWHYAGTHVSAPWSFSLEHAKHSPGHVLLRQSVLAALDANLHTYDLGLGDQAYKFRLPARRNNCQTWGLYAW